MTRPNAQPLAMEPATRQHMRLPALLVPHRNLLRYYALQSLLFGPFFPFALVPLYLRFRSLRYALDAEGITMRWGVLFRREVSLTYARIQDIHLTSNVVERWLGLARIQVQTASGNAAAEMTIEGVPDVDSMRDFLYERMRGVADETETAPVVRRGEAYATAPPEPPARPQLHATPGANTSTAVRADEVAELTAVLRDVAAELRALRIASEAARAEQEDA
jgi:membrane protein YdbS with pleckstrin-like domain